MYRTNGGRKTAKNKRILSSDLKNHAANFVPDLRRSQAARLLQVNVGKGVNENGVEKHAFSFGMVNSEGRVNVR